MNFLPHVTLKLPPDLVPASILQIMPQGMSKEEREQATEKLRQKQEAEARAAAHYRPVARGIGAQAASARRETSVEPLNELRKHQQTVRKLRKIRKQ